MRAPKIPDRVIVLIVIHVVSTVVMVRLTLALTPGDFSVGGGLFWLKSYLGFVLFYTLISQIYLMVFWMCLGKTAWQRRLVVGFVTLVGLGIVLVGVGSGVPNWVRMPLALLVQLVVLAAPLSTFRLTGRKLLVTAPERELGVLVPRWSLKELLIGLTLATIYVAIVRYLSFHREHSWANPAVFPLVGLACVVPIFLAVRLWKLLLVIILLDVILAAIIAWISTQWYVERFGHMIQSGSKPMTVQEVYFQELPSVALAVSIVTTILLGSLLVVRSCGYRWAQCDEEESG